MSKNIQEIIEAEAQIKTFNNSVNKFILVERNNGEVSLLTKKKIDAMDSMKLLKALSITENSEMIADYIKASVLNREHIKASGYFTTKESVVEALKEIGETFEEYIDISTKELNNHIDSKKEFESLEESDNYKIEVEYGIRERDEIKDSDVLSYNQEKIDHYVFRKQMKLRERIKTIDNEQIPEMTVDSLKSLNELVKCAIMNVNPKITSVNIESEQEPSVLLKEILQEITNLEDSDMFFNEETEITALKRGINDEKLLFLGSKTFEIGLEGIKDRTNKNLSPSDFVRIGSDKMIADIAQMKLVDNIYKIDNEYKLTNFHQLLKDNDFKTAIEIKDLGQNVKLLDKEDIMEIINSHNGELKFGLENDGEEYSKLAVLEYIKELESNSVNRIQPSNKNKI